MVLIFCRRSKAVLMSLFCSASTRRAVASLTRISAFFRRRSSSICLTDRSVAGSPAAAAASFGVVLRRLRRKSPAAGSWISEASSKTRTCPVGRFSSAVCLTEAATAGAGSSAASSLSFGTALWPLGAETKRSCPVALKRFPMASHDLRLLLGSSADRRGGSCMRSCMCPCAANLCICNPLLASSAPSSPAPAREGGRAGGSPMSLSSSMLCFCSSSNAAMKSPPFSCSTCIATVSPAGTFAFSRRRSSIFCATL